MEYSDSVPPEAMEEFHLKFGRAMGAWATVERELGTLFMMLTKIEPAMATQIYYSARSFTGRLDILKSSLAAAKVTDEAKNVTQKVITKSRQYCEFRNKIAHDLPVLGPGHPPGSRAQMVIVDAKSQFQPPELKKHYLDRGVTIEDMAHIANCFDALAKIIWDLWSELATGRGPLHGKYLQRLVALPNLPPPKGQSPPSAMPEHPPPSSEE
jgi:hypothetical protein